MLKQRTFKKGEQIFALISSNTAVNILIPVHGVIKDIEYDDVNPKYLIKIDKFYDSYHFILDNFFDVSFKYSFESRSRMCKIKKETVTSLEKLEEILENPRYWIVVEGLMVKKFLNETREMMDKINDFLIIKSLREMKDYMTRTAYQGKFKMNSEMEWILRFKSMFGERFTQAEFQKLMKMI